MNDQHAITYRLQPVTPDRETFFIVFCTTVLNWGALFGAAVVVGYGLRLGWLAA